MSEGIRKRCDKVHGIYERKTRGERGTEYVSHKERNREIEIRGWRGKEERGEREIIERNRKRTNDGKAYWNISRVQSNY